MRNVVIIAVTYSKGDNYGKFPVTSFIKNVIIMLNVMN